MKLNLKNILLIVISVFAGIVLLIIGKPNFSDKSERVVLNIEGKDYVLLTARTTLEKARGLSGIMELKNADGMIFYPAPLKDSKRQFVFLGKTFLLPNWQDCSNIFSFFLSVCKKTQSFKGDGVYFESNWRPTFWNKNTHLDLELVWMNSDKILSRDFLPSEDKEGLVIKQSPGEVDKVVELVR